MTHKPTILVVEDESLIRELISEELEETGFTVVSADSTASAIHEIDADGRVDGALVDIDLRDRGGGYIVARHAQARWPGMVIVYTSGGAQARFETERVEGSLFVPKPYSPSRVCALLRDRMRVTDDAA